MQKTVIKVNDNLARLLKLLPYKNGYSSGHGKGHGKMSDEHKKKIGDAHRGKKKNYLVWNKGLIGYMAGAKNANWKGGITPYYRLLRIARLKAVGGSHTKQEWDDMKKFYNYMCLCCKKQEPFIKLTQDHIIPVSRGGSNDISNIQPLCFSCNSRKHTLSTNFTEIYKLTK